MFSQLLRILMERGATIYNLLGSVSRDSVTAVIIMHVTMDVKLPRAKVALGARAASVFFLSSLACDKSSPTS